MSVHLSSLHQLFMCAAFHDLPIFQDIDAICHSHRRESVADDDSDTISKRMPKHIEEFEFRLRIHGTAGLIEHDDLSIPHERPRQSYSLPFTDTQLLAPFEPLAKEGIIALF